MAPLATLLMWPNLVSPSSAPWGWVRCLDRRYKNLFCDHGAFPNVDPELPVFQPFCQWHDFQCSPQLQGSCSHKNCRTPFPILYCFNFSLFSFFKVGSFPFLCPCLPSRCEWTGRAIFLLLNPPFVKSVVWYHSLELYLQAQLERRARTGQALFLQPLLTARCTITQESPSGLLWSSELWKWVLEMKLSRKVTSSAERQQVRTSDATLTFLMQL